MTTAQQLIESAYARSTANDAGKLAQDPELLLHLNRRYQALFALMAVLLGDSALTSVALVFGGGPPAFVPLPLDIIDIDRAEQASGVLANVIPADEKDRSWHLAPAMYRKGNSLVSRGKAGDPGVGYTITLFYLDAPAPLSTLASTVDPRFAVRYENILVLDLAVYLSVKDENRDEREFKALKDELEDEMKAFNILVGKASTANQRTANT